MSLRDLEILSYLSSCVPDNGNILELGPFLGRSTSALVKHKKENVSLEVVDTFSGFPLDMEYNDLMGDRELYEQLRALAKDTGSWLEPFKKCQSTDIQNINIHACSTKEFKIKKWYDMTFVDTEHTFNSVMHDVGKFISASSLILGDDFVPWWSDISKALTNFHYRSYRTLVVPRGSKIWILVPKNSYWESCVKEVI